LYRYIIIKNIIIINRDRSVGIAIGYQMENLCSITGRVKIFPPFTTSKRALKPSQSPIEEILDFSPGLNRPEREASHFPSPAYVTDGGPKLQSAYFMT
jgi:hypothetical protein